MSGPSRSDRPGPGAATASASVEVAAPAEDVFAWLTDLDTMAGFAEEAEAMVWRSGSPGTPGAVFVGRNRNGVRRWSTTCTVTDAEPGQRFGFDVVSLGVVPVAHWEYAIEADGAASCRLTESTWDRRPVWFRKPAQLVTGVSDRTAASEEHIAATLRRIQQYAEGA